MESVFNVNEFIKYVGALIALLDPIGAVPIMLALTPNYTQRQRTRVAIVATITVFVALLVTAWAGQAILAFFAISVDMFRSAGGLLILLIAISMIMPSQDRPAKAAPDATDRDPAIVPLGIPLLCGPGAIATVILFASHPHPQWSYLSAHAAAITVVTLITLACLLAATQLERYLGKAGIRIATQIMGLILAAIGVEMIVGGLQAYFGWPLAASSAG